MLSADGDVDSSDARVTRSAVGLVASFEGDVTGATRAQRHSRPPSDTAQDPRMRKRGLCKCEGEMTSVERIRWLVHARGLTGRKGVEDWDVDGIEGGRDSKDNNEREVTLDTPVDGSCTIEKSDSSVNAAIQGPSSATRTERTICSSNATRAHSNTRFSLRSMMLHTRTDPIPGSLIR